MRIGEGGIIGTMEVGKFVEVDRGLVETAGEYEKSS